MKCVLFVLGFNLIVIRVFTIRSTLHSLCLELCNTFCSILCLFGCICIFFKFHVILFDKRQYLCGEVILPLNTLFKQCNQIVFSGQIGGSCFGEQCNSIICEKEKVWKRSIYGIV